ncbi:Hypothetical protein CINCED_3A008307 [Cinara cedri]|uniref:Uncharacterized protein n=1 Tax=Cinara cedri TaxID=506608 RepID=A0A5E4MEJ4_9HEMI|nr:Hypothetical protein CINCED_3A008307 [Cinara cedri]
MGDRTFYRLTESRGQNCARSCMEGRRKTIKRVTESRINGKGLQVLLKDKTFWKAPNKMDGRRDKRPRNGPRKHTIKRCEL